MLKQKIKKISVAFSSLVFFVFFAGKSLAQMQIPAQTAYGPARPGFMGVTLALWRIARLYVVFIVVIVAVVYGVYTLLRVIKRKNNEVKK